MNSAEPLHLHAMRACPRLAQSPSQIDSAERPLPLHLRRSPSTKRELLRRTTMGLQRRPATGKSILRAVIRRKMVTGSVPSTPFAHSGCLIPRQRAVSPELVAGRCAFSPPETVRLHMDRHRKRAAPYFRCYIILLLASLCKETRSLPMVLCRGWFGIVYIVCSHCNIPRY